MSNLPIAWLTPLFDDSDILVTRVMTLRAALWSPVFAILEEQARAWNWFQDDPTHATVKEVIAELIKGRTMLERGPALYIGEVREFALQDPPEGWLRCDGATYANVDYPELAAIINPGFVVDADNFRVPDRNRRLGMDGLTVGMQEGEETHTLSVGELPAHHHGYTAPFGESLAVQPGDLPVVVGMLGSDTDDTGGDGAHNNIQPVEGTQFYIRAAWPTAGG